VNLPSGKYARNSPDSAVEDANNYSNYTIGREFRGVGFLIARYTYQLAANGTDWTLYDTEDLRGKLPNTSAGGGVGGGGVTTFTALTDTPNSYLGEALKVPRINVGETALEFAFLSHTNLLDIGTNSHAQIDIGIASFLAHEANSSIHFTEASIDHTAIANIGTNTHAQIDTHIANITTNPHAVEWVDLSDKDRVPQAATTVAAATGAVDLDMAKSVQDITLTGNVTAITFSNEPAVGDRVSALLNVYQNATGGYTMAWTGSGVYAEDGKVAADFQPLATALALTQYWLNWTGSKWIITLIKTSLTQL